MRELSLNILDIAQNSITAHATLVTISILTHTDRDRMVIEIEDDGVGMSEDFVAKVIDPFTTTRTTRKVGMGIPLFKMAAECTGGNFSIRSTVGVGTCTHAEFVLSSIDRMPLGDMTETLLMLITGAPTVEFKFVFVYDAERFDLDTREVKAILQGMPLDSIEVKTYLREYISENIKLCSGGNLL